MEPSLPQLVELGTQALWLTAALTLPLLVASFAISALIGVLQSATQIHDPALSHLPRLVVVGITLTYAGAWMGGEIVAFAARVFGLSVP